jgi:hypothetical protein
MAQLPIVGGEMPAQDDMQSDGLIERIAKTMVRLAHYRGEQMFSFNDTLRFTEIRDSFPDNSAHWVQYSLTKGAPQAFRFYKHESNLIELNMHGRALRSGWEQYNAAPLDADATPIQLTTKLMLLSVNAVTELIEKPNGVNTLRGISVLRSSYLMLQEMLFDLADMRDALLNLVRQLRGLIAIKLPKSQISLTLLLKDTSFKQRIERDTPEKFSLMFKLLNGGSSYLEGRANDRRVPVMHLMVARVDTVNLISLDNSTVRFAVTEDAADIDTLVFNLSRLNVDDANCHTLLMTPLHGGYERLATAIHRQGNNVRTGVMYGHLQFGETKYIIEQQPFIGHPLATWKKGETDGDYDFIAATRCLRTCAMKLSVRC